MFPSFKFLEHSAGVTLNTGPNQFFVPLGAVYARIFTKIACVYGKYISPFQTSSKRNKLAEVINIITGKYQFAVEWMNIQYITMIYDSM